MAKMTGADYTNLGLGAYSLVQGLTAKRPGKLQPTKMRSVIRPAQGDAAALTNSKNEIAQQVSSATRDVSRIAGSDVGRSIAARLGIHKSATDASVKAEHDNARMIREDQNRMSQELNQEAYTNALLENQANQANFEVDQQNFQNTQAAARAGVNSSVNYIAQREANLDNNKIIERQSQERANAIKAAAYQDAYTQAIINKKSPEEAKKIASQAISRFGIYPK